LLIFYDSSTFINNTHNIKLLFRRYLSQCSCWMENMSEACRLLVGVSPTGYSSEGFTISSRFSNSLYAPNRKFLKNRIKKLISISLRTLRERTKTTNRTIVHVFSLQIKLYLSDRQRSTSDPLSLLSGSSLQMYSQDLAFLLMLRLIRKLTHSTYAA